MKFLAVVCCSLVAAAAAAPAAADAVDRGFRPPMQRQGERAAPAPQRGPDQAATPQRNPDPPPAPGRGPRAMGAGDLGRMSPDERRQLRRDIQDAGKDLYHPLRQGPADRARSERR